MVNRPKITCMPEVLAGLIVQRIDIVDANAFLRSIRVPGISKRVAATIPPLTKVA